MQSVFGDADAPIVVELAQKPGSTRRSGEAGRVMWTVTLLRFRTKLVSTAPQSTGGSASDSGSRSG